MTDNVAVEASSRRRSGRRVVASTAVVIAAIDVVVVALLLLVDRVEVASRQALDQVALGMPLPWVTQDQGIDPSIPHGTGFLSAWQHPTTLEWAPLAANLVIVGLVLLGAWRGIRSWRARTEERVCR